MEQAHTRVRTRVCRALEAANIAARTPTPMAAAGERRPRVSSDRPLGGKAANAALFRTRQLGGSPDGVMFDLAAAPNERRLVFCGRVKEPTMKFSRKFGARYGKVLYVLGVVAMFVVAAGADRKFH